MLKDGFAHAEHDMAARAARGARRGRAHVLATCAALQADGDLLTPTSGPPSRPDGHRPPGRPGDDRPPSTTPSRRWPRAPKPLPPLRMNRGIRQALAGRAAPRRGLTMPVIRILPHAEFCPAGRRPSSALRHLDLRSPARERHRHRARLRDELRLHHLPRDRARRLRSLGEMDESEEDLLDRAWGLSRCRA
jgi:2Fe-2S ferredoxin